MSLSTGVAAPEGPMRSTTSGRRRRNLQLLDVSFRIETDVHDSLQRLDRLYSAPEFCQLKGQAPIQVRFHLGELHPEEHWVEVNGHKEPIEPAASDPAAWAFARFLDTTRNFLLVHAGALAHHGKGLLLVGPPFAGKTTLAVGLAERGLLYYSDDVAPIAHSDGLLYPFRRAAAVRSSLGGRDFHFLGLKRQASQCTALPPPCPLRWVFILDCLPSDSAPENKHWCLILTSDASEAEQGIVASKDIVIVARSQVRGGVRLDLASTTGGGFAEALRRFVDEWSRHVLYLGPAPRRSALAVPEQPTVTPISREEAALEMLRHTFNRTSRSELYAQYRKDPHVKAYAEILMAIGEAGCFRLRPGRSDRTVDAVRGLIASQDAVYRHSEIQSSSYAPL